MTRTKVQAFVARTAVALMLTGVAWTYVGHRMEVQLHAFAAHSEEHGEEDDDHRCPDCGCCPNGVCAAKHGKVCGALNCSLHPGSPCDNEGDIDNN